MKIFIVTKSVRDDDGILHESVLSAFLDEDKATEFAKVNVKFTNEDTWVLLIEKPGEQPQIIKTFP